MRAKKRLLLVLIFIFTLLVGCTQKGDAIFDLEKFQNSQDQFQYQDLEWGTSHEDALDSFSMEFDEFDAEFEDYEYFIYTSKEEIEYGGEKGTITMDFKDDKLMSLTFNFWLFEDPDKWVEDVKTKLVSIYGEPTENKTLTGDEEGNLKLKGEMNKWEKDETMLLADFFVNEKDERSARIGLGLKN